MCRVMRRLLRLALRVTILCGLVLVARRWWAGRDGDDAMGDGWADKGRDWQPPAPPATASAAAPTAAAAPPAAAAAPTPTPASAPAPAPAPAPAEVVAEVEATASTAPGGAEAAAPPETGTPETGAPETAATAPPVAPRTTKRKAAPADTPPRIWVEPVGTTCPPDHPVKVKMASRLLRVPGMFAYDRTRPDRCYPNEDEAIAEGFTRAQR